MIKTTEMTHDDLRKLAVKWLTNTRKCTVILSEIVTCATQIPDAIGWQSERSTLVECKVSRADFLRDKDKAHQRALATPGMKRFYLTPPGLLQLSDLPDGWGLIEARDGYVKILRDSEHFSMTNRAMSDEIAMLVSALRWGLIEARDGYVKILRDSEHFSMTNRAMSDEIAMLVSALRQVKQREFLVIVAELSSENS